MKKNGLLLYCTCSLCREEGEEQINNVVRENDDFKIVSLKDKMVSELKKTVTKEGYVRILPQYLEKFGGADGFFVACLKKVC